MKKELLKEIIRTFHREPLPATRPRDIVLPLDSGKIITLSGVRRSGKSFLLFDTMKLLMVEHGVSKERILYINFEDERIELSQGEVQLVLQAYQELYPDLDIAHCYLFFDEIQNVSGWERFVRRIYDTSTRNIFITGSNAVLLSREIATALRGRSVSFAVYPLSFREYLRFRDISDDIYHTRTAARIASAFGDFLIEGGDSRN